MMTQYKYREIQAATKLGASGSTNDRALKAEGERGEYVRTEDPAIAKPRQNDTVRVVQKRDLTGHRYPVRSKGQRRERRDLGGKKRYTARVQCRAQGTGRGAGGGSEGNTLRSAVGGETKNAVAG